MIRANYPRWQREAMAIYSAGGAEVGAGLGCGKARYGTVARLHSTCSREREGGAVGDPHGNATRISKGARRCGESERCCLALTCPGEWPVRTEKLATTVYGWMDSRAVTVRSLALVVVSSGKRTVGYSGTCTVLQHYAAAPSVTTGR